MTKSEGNLVLKPVKINAKIFIKKIIEQEKALGAEKSLQLINEQKNIPQFFYGDEELLYRAIINVIANAVDYSPVNGKIFFQVTIHKENLQFLIADSGRGFSEEELKSAGEQFYKGDKSRNSKSHYGIGLYITKSFVEMHHGSVELSNSIELTGAQVILKIPLDTKV